MFGFLKKKKQEETPAPAPTPEVKSDPMERAMELLEKAKQKQQEEANRLWEKPVGTVTAKDRSEMYFNYVQENYSDANLSKDRNKACRLIEIANAMEKNMLVGEQPDPEDSTKTYFAIDNRIARIVALIYFEGIYVEKDWEQVVYWLDRAVVEDMTDDVTLSVASPLYTNPENPNWEIEKGVHCAMLLAKRCYEPGFDLLKSYMETEKDLQEQELDALFEPSLTKEAEALNEYLVSLGESQEAHLLRGLMYFYGFGMPQDVFAAKKEILQADQNDMLVKNLLANPLLPDDEEFDEYEEDDDDEDDE